MLDEERVRPHVATGAKPGPHVCITVSDTGVGLDEETRTRIFEPFFTTRSTDRAVGLGLPVSQALVQAHGGNLWLSSNAPGATFVMELPLA